MCRISSRFGSALTDSGVIHIKNAVYGRDFTPLDPDCDCKVCKTYTRSAIHIMYKDEVGMRSVCLFVILSQTNYVS